jgi:acyl-CoA synthetase (AMP-forming)/AMP-acid ligase II
VAAHCAADGTTLPSLRRVLCAGAPVPADLWVAARALLPQGRLHSPYGATEALPVSTVTDQDIDPASVAGACVGRSVAGMEIRIIPLADGPLESLPPALPVDSVGEIVVRGPPVTRAYDQLPEATRAAKIPDPERPGQVWHRLGDCGRMDAAGRLWFLGRVVERVITPAGTLFTEPCEQVFRAHPRARRCALVGVGAEPALVVEARLAGGDDGRRLAADLRQLGLRHPHTRGIRSFYFRARLPVDVRHNAKIHRLALARWAARARAYRPA